MRKKILFLVSLLILIILIGVYLGENKSKQNKILNNMRTKSEADTITKAEALKIANENAAQYYNDLTIYEIEVKYEKGSWHVDYILNDPGMVGGGPHYVISAFTGKIESSRFEQ